MKKPVGSSLQNLSISYEFALAIGNSLNLSEMLHEVIYTMVHKTNAHHGIIWIKNGEKKLQPVASAGINMEDVPAQGEIMNLRNVLNQIQKSRQFVLRYKDDKDFLQYCPILTEKKESVLIVPVTNVAILYLVYAGREIADEPLGNLLAGLSKKLSVAIEACMTHKNIINEVRVRVEAEEKEKEHHKNIELLSETAMKFVDFPQDDDIYTYIGEQLQKFISKNSFVIVNSINTETNILTTRSIIGMGKLSEKVAGLLGKNPVGMTYDAEDKDIWCLSTLAQY
nr:hypothetical protein [Bacteroidota bacterium]